MDQEKQLLHLRSYAPESYVGSSSVWVGPKTLKPVGCACVIFMKFPGSSAACKGIITIDPGAEKALNKGNSLLPAGVTVIKRISDRGDVVKIQNQDGEQIAVDLIAKHLSCIC